MADIPAVQPSASYSITIRARIPQMPGSFARVAGAIGQTGAILGAIDLVRVDGRQVVRDVTVSCADSEHGEAVVRAVRGLEGVANVIVCDIEGALYDGRPGLDPLRAELAQRTNPDDERGMADDLLADADVLIGVSGPRAVSPRAVRSMASDAVVFAMANPTPEVQPEAVRDAVAIMATGRSDYPNQINNVLAFPGVFRGALDVRARAIDEEMKLAAAHALAAVVGDDEVHADYIIPSAFNREVAPAVAAAVAQAAAASGAAS